MKKITFSFFLIMFMFGTFAGFSQTLNQNASWPNGAWTLTGTDAAETDVDILEANPTTVDANFAFDDDDAGGSSDNDIAAESPVIDLTAAAGSGETWISVFGDYVYRYLADDALLFEYWDADANAWFAWGPEFDAGTAGAPTNNYCSATPESYTTEVLDISGFTATQLAGFKYRISYNDNPAGSDWNYGFCFQSPTIVSATPPSCITPTALSASVSSATTAELSWNSGPGGTETLWDIELLDVTASDTATGTPTATGVTNPYTAMGLTEGNEYEFYVRSDCEGDGLSEWAGPFAWTQNVPPANDECSNAIALTVNTDINCGSVTTGTTVFATASPQADDVTGTPNNDVWFSFVASSSGHIVSLSNVTAVTGFSTDMGIGVYDGTGGCAALVLEDDSDPNSLSLSGLTIGTTYLVRVYGWSSSATATAQTTFDICVGTTPPPPANDECVDAIALTVNTDLSCTATTSGTIASATASGEDEASCGGTEDDDVWFTFVASAETHTIELLNITGGTTDLYHSLWSGDCGTLTNILCSDPNSSTATGLTIGETYTLRVYSWTSTPGQTSSFDVCIGTLPDPPANDECTDAIALTVNTDLSCTATTSGTIASATASGEDEASCGGTEDDDVWFTFVASAETHTIELLNITGSTTDLYHSLWSGDCGTLTNILCSDPNSSTATGLTIGETYTLRVYSWTSTPGQTSSFDVCIGTPCTADAGTLTADATPVTLSGGTATISATGNGDIIVPTDYEVIYVLTSGPDLIIQNTNNTAPTFDVTTAGDYIIHTLVAEVTNSSSPNFLNLTDLELGVTTGGDILGLIGVLCADLDVIGAPITVIEQCTVDAGSLTADATAVTLTGGTAPLNATPNGDAVVPIDYEVTYVLTSGPTLIIEAVNDTPSFDVNTTGNYTIHTLVAETSDSTDPNYLDLSGVNFGTTTASEVLTNIILGGLCADLDVTGAPITVIECTADAGTLTADATPVTLTGGTATISATEDTAPTVPTNYEVTYVLTFGPTLIIEAAGATPSFDVTTPGDYIIHTLVAETTDATDPNYVDLSLIAFGTTTAADVLALFASSGITCVALDVNGAPITVEENLSVGNEDDQAAFSYYPNPVKNTLKLTAQNNIENVEMYNMLGQVVLRATPNTLESDLDMSSLQTGTYFVKVTIESISKTIRVIKE